MNNKGIFVTGTDTGVGKTLVSTALIRLLVKKGIKVAGMKPVASGCEMTEQGLRNEDAIAIIQESNLQLDYNQVNPYAYAAPVSPHFAAQESGRNIDIETICRTYQHISMEADFVVVEGVGGWQVPLSSQHSVADLAKALDLPVLLVVGLRLGCINHSLLTAEAIKAKGLHLTACVASQIDADYLRAEETLQTLEDRLGIAVQRVPWLESRNDQDIIEQTVNCLKPIKEKIYESI